MWRLSCWLSYIAIVALSIRCAEAHETPPVLRLENSIPKVVVKKLAVDGYIWDARSKVVVWNKGGVHYFFVFKDRGQGCGVADFDLENREYRIIDSYAQCKLGSKLAIKDVLGNGSRAIVFRLKVHSNGSADVDADITNVYLYINKQSKFCKNDDAGSFVDGTRVPNSVIKFGPSSCR
ncbi:hypothetical protein [Burkholderia ambifaria]|jgi:hypothetical protein|uniref:hypothetical protein n=1 Tax=Burkholderia ambifaria TaxID=152480 RepID=UPI00158C7A72|nr:hypothetical protein [Burkholderia ambifaria]